MSGYIGTVYNKQWVLKYSVRAGLILKVRVKTKEKKIIEKKITRRNK